MDRITHMGLSNLNETVLFSFPSYFRSFGSKNAPLFETQVEYSSHNSVFYSACLFLAENDLIICIGGGRPSLTSNHRYYQIL